MNRTYGLRRRNPRLYVGEIRLYNGGSQAAAIREDVEPKVAAAMFNAHFAGHGVLKAMRHGNRLTAEDMRIEPGLVRNHWAGY